MTVPVRIALVEDDPQLTATLRRIIARAEDLECIACSASGEAAHTELPPLAPDIILMDLNLPGISGIEATRGLNQLLPETPFSPIEQLKLRGKTRQRASAPKAVRADKTAPWRWGDKS